MSDEDSTKESKCCAEFWDDFKTFFCQAIFFFLTVGSGSLLYYNLVVGDLKEDISEVLYHLAMEVCGLSEEESNSAPSQDSNTADSPPWVKDSNKIRLSIWIKDEVGVGAFNFLAFLEFYLPVIVEILNIITVFVDVAVVIDNCNAKNLTSRQIFTFLRDRKGLAISSIFMAFVTIVNFFTELIDPNQTFFNMYKIIMHLVCYYKIWKSASKREQEDFYVSTKRIAEPDFQLPDGKDPAQHGTSRCKKCFSCVRMASQLCSKCGQAW